MRSHGSCVRAYIKGSQRPPVVAGRGAMYVKGLK